MTFLVVSSTPVASASTEPPGAYDGRSLAMGGTGAAHIHSGAAIYHNPANLNDIDRAAFTLDFTGNSPTITSPVNGPQTSLHSDFSVYPLFLVGGGYRLSERFVLGLAVYPTAGFGSGYSKVDSINGEDLKFAIVMIEAVPAVSVRVTDNLSLGLGYRLTYARQSAHSPGPSDVTLSGTNFAGVHLGLNYLLAKGWQVGLSYRSKVTTSLTGTTTLQSTPLDTRSSFASPHTFKVGTAYSFLDKRLLLALDVKYLLYSEANQQIETTVTTPAGPQTIVVPLSWKNVVSAGVGGEYWMSASLAIRGGYFISQSATPKSTVNYFTVPPGVINSFHLGVGLILSNWDLDLGALYAFNGQRAQPSQANPPAFPGNYSLSSFIFSVSTTYHL